MTTAHIVTRILTPQDAVKHLSSYFTDLDLEQLVIMSLDHKNYVVSNIRFNGCDTYVNFNLKEILKKVILSNGNKIIIAHNHPSGQCYASKSDIRLTNYARLISDMLGIACLDHIIFTHENYFSFREHKLI